MKHPLLFVAIGLSLVACSEKQPDKVTTPVPSFIKASTVRPASIPATLVSVDTCSIDLVNDQPAKGSISIMDKAKIKLAGWAADVATGASPQEVFIEFDGPTKNYIKSSRSLKRPDVATHFNKPALADSGREAYADLSGAGAGTYKMRIIQVEGQTGLVCDTRRSIVIN